MKVVCESWSSVIACMHKVKKSNSNPMRGKGKVLRVFTPPSHFHGHERQSFLLLLLPSLFLSFHSQDSSGWCTAPRIPSTRILIRSGCYAKHGHLSASSLPFFPLMKRATHFIVSLVYYPLPSSQPNYRSLIPPSFYSAFHIISRFDLPPANKGQYLPSSPASD